jgi:hypothetical protein
MAFGAGLKTLFDEQRGIFFNALFVVYLLRPCHSDYVILA